MSSLLQVMGKNRRGKHEESDREESITGKGEEKENEEKN